MLSLLDLESAPSLPIGVLCGVIASGSARLDRVVGGVDEGGLEEQSELVPDKGIHRLHPRLAFVPWTAVLPRLAGAFSDRIGGKRLTAAGLALQALGLAWIATVATPTLPCLDTVASARTSAGRRW